MSDKIAKTLRLHMPQWQGGNLSEYHLSSKLLSWLLPDADGPQETVPIPAPQIGKSLDIQDGILAKPALLEQARAARAAIERHLPDRILTIGGDCLVDLAPIAYLNKRYEGRIGVLWIDAHPDVQTVQDTDQGNAQVLGYLLKRGDRDFVAEVDIAVNPSRVMYAGLNEWSHSEGSLLQELNLRHLGSQQLECGYQSVLDWIEQQEIQHIAVHLDVDSINPQRFQPMLFNKPQAGTEFLAGVPRGRLEPNTVVELLHAVGSKCDIVGLAITEYISWDALQTRSLLRRLPLIGSF